MAIARRIGIALAIVGSVLTLAATTPPRFSPGYTYRLRISSRVTEPNGKTTDYLDMLGHATVTDYGGRLDIDDAPSGAMARKGRYILYDSKTMTIVSPKDRHLLRFALDDLEPGLSFVNAPGTQVSITDVAVHFENIGAAEPMLGMPTTKYRITQDYKLAANLASQQRNSTEHIVQDVWTAEERSRLANPFSRQFQGRVGPGDGFRELMARTAEAEGKMGRGIPLETVTTTTSTSSSNAVTKTVSTMEVTDLQEGNIDDELLATPTGYQVTEAGTLAKTSRTSQGTQAGAPAKVARPAATGDAAAAAKGEFVKELHSMGRRP